MYIEFWIKIILHCCRHVYQYRRNRLVQAQNRYLDYLHNHSIICKTEIKQKPTWKNECDLCATCRAISTSTESSCALRRSWASRPVVSTSRNLNKIIRFLYYFWGKCVVVPAEGIPCPWRWGRWRRRSQGGSGQSQGPGKKVKKVEDFACFFFFKKNLPRTRGKRLTWRTWKNIGLRLKMFVRFRE